MLRPILNAPVFKLLSSTRLKKLPLKACRFCGIINLFNSHSQSALFHTFAMRTALLIVDHGSRREEANQMLHRVAGILRQKRPQLIVQIAHMELAEPTIRQGIEACVHEGATEIVVHPYMLSPGRHATQDIPRMATEAAAAYPAVTIRVTAPLGLHEKLGEVILQRAGL